MNRRTGPGVIVLGLAVLILAAGEAQADSLALPGAAGPRVAFQAGPKDYVPQGLVDFREHLCFVSGLSTGAVGIPGCPGSLVFITPLIALGFAWWMGLRHPAGLAGLGAATMSLTSVVAFSNPVAVLVVLLASLSIGAVAWAVAR